MSPEKLKDYSEHHAVTYHFPDACARPSPRTTDPSPRRRSHPRLSKKIPDAGSNTKIRDQLNNLILKSPQNWQTSVALPFFQIEG